MALAVDKVAIGQVILHVLWFPLAVLFHRHSVFTAVLAVLWRIVPIAAQFHRNISSLNLDNKVRDLELKPLVERVFDKTNGQGNS